MRRFRCFNTGRWAISSYVFSTCILNPSFAPWDSSDEVSARVLVWQTPPSHWVASNARRAPMQNHGLCIVDVCTATLETIMGQASLRHQHVSLLNYGIYLLCPLSLRVVLQAIKVCSKFRGASGSSISGLGIRFETHGRRPKQPQTLTQGPKNGS